MINQHYFYWVLNGSVDGNKLLLFKNVKGAHVDSLTLNGGDSKQGGGAYIRSSSPYFSSHSTKSRLTSG